MIITKGSSEHKATINSILPIFEMCARQNGLNEHKLREFLDRKSNDNGVHIQVMIYIFFK